ncbi:hypothetical protein [Agromyces mariniharenae]|uniref:Uncharacterized protein n=1 Tax=Agromyces mariniharenae TaxID=2604423 RepID=A0A5S4UWB3_9MICO|nr:hypothetical protein [Agromyces mariniharenae]TYL51167.1 hypothetical protein FYC51_18800 [Agromyces mariniharenae]
MLKIEIPSNVPRGARLSAIAGIEYHGEWADGVHRLAPLVHGKVAALHLETLDLATCDFNEQIDWVGTDDGVFVRVGATLSLDGEPGGSYTIAAPINDDGAVPALRVGESDNAPGIPADIELHTAIIREEGNSPVNAGGFRLLHFTQSVICSSDNPHPDGARPISGGPPWCYTGEGAALNNRFGVQFDRYGRRIYDFEHVLWYSGYEVIASKRPNTKRYPVPVRWSTTTPIRWRPYHETAPQV